ncbi:MAG TPA: hypothetical protein VIK78_19030 [Ruminiclostridium sp.]
MSYYGVSVLITILVTSLMAFYLLYKSKELSLGVLISISIGSIILGFTLNPAFMAVLKVLSDNININKKLALVISLFIILFIFLIFILVVSFIISFCMPRKLASIDCGVVIDKLISKIKNKDGIIIKEKWTELFGKIILFIKEILKNVYNLRNQLKKSVDTKQIIDTMGIEKNEKDILGQESINTIDTADFANLLGFMESPKELAYQEVASTKISIIEVDEDVDENELNNLEDLNYLEEINLEVNIEDQVVKCETIEDKAIDEEIDRIEYIEESVKLESVIDANSLVLKAFESKNVGRKEEAIEHYIEALRYGPDNEMIFWIVLDVCSLYKQLDLIELAKNILEGLVSEYRDLIRPELKRQIMINLK